MSAPTPDFVLGYRAMMLDGLAREVETTKKVLAAVPDGKKDYRPDPCARTAWELAWHLANTDVQFLDGIADLKFNMANPAAEDKPKTIAEVVDWYDRNMKRGADISVLWDRRCLRSMAGVTTSPFRRRRRVTRSRGR